MVSSQSDQSGWMSILMILQWVYMQFVLSYGDLPLKLAHEIDTTVHFCLADNINVDLD